MLVFFFKEKSILQYISGFPFGEVCVMKLSYLAGLHSLEQGWQTLIQAALAQPGRHCLSIPALFLDKIKSSLPGTTNQPYNPPCDSTDVKSMEKIGQARLG